MPYILISFIVVLTEIAPVLNIEFWKFAIIFKVQWSNFFPSFRLLFNYLLFLSLEFLKDDGWVASYFFKIKFRFSFRRLDNFRVFNFISKTSLDFLSIWRNLKRIFSFLKMILRNRILKNICSWRLAITFLNWIKSNRRRPEDLQNGFKVWDS